MLTREQQIEAEKEAAKYPDIDIINCVLRGDLIVLQTSAEHFENMSLREKIQVISHMKLCLVALEEQVRG